MRYWVTENVISICTDRPRQNKDLVGRPGLDPGTLGLKGTYKTLLSVDLVVLVVCFQGNALLSVDLVL
jgi:hypothetical protein